jgi:hypothetical protein
MLDLDEAFEKLGKLANQLYDDAQIDDRIAAAIETTRDIAHEIRRGVGRLLDDLGGIDENTLEPGDDDTAVDHAEPAPAPDDDAFES